MSEDKSLKFDVKNLKPEEFIAPVSLVFGDKEISSAVNGFLSGIFNKNTNIYDKAIDSAYTSNGIGNSGIHHIVDGNHSFSGSLHSANNALTDDSNFEATKAAFEHLMKDFTTESGINPLFSVNPDTLEKAKNIIEGSAGVSRSWVNDILTMNSFEAAGAAVAVAGAVYGFKKKDYYFTGRLIGSSSWSSVVGGNPLLAAVTIIIAAKAWNQAEYEEKKFLKKGMVRGGILTGVATTVAAVVGGPAVLGIAAGIYAAHVTGMKLDGRECNDIVTSTLKKTAASGTKLVFKTAGFTIRRVLKI